VAEVEGERREDFDLDGNRAGVRPGARADFDTACGLGTSLGGTAVHPDRSGPGPGRDRARAADPTPL